MKKGHYTAIVTGEFIRRRDAIIAKKLAEGGKLEDLYRRWDCELPEYHQASVDPDQTLYEDWHFDTIYKTKWHLDYKQYSQDGIHISNPILEQIKAGNIHYIIVWEWDGGNRHKRLYENDEISYNIIGIVPAQQVIDTIKNNRFPFER